MDRAKQHLLDHNVKPSIQRLTIMKYLMEHHTHPTADMIFNDLYQEIPTLSKTTVYNTLKLLSENGAVRTIGIDDKNARFDGDMSPHAHFRCKNCGCIYDIPLDGKDKIFVDGIGELTIDEVHLYYKGFCKECLTQNELKN
ncbi:MAG: Fur family transcriptional regulator [Bacteroidales bacterium]